MTDEFPRLRLFHHREEYDLSINFTLEYKRTLYSERIIIRDIPWGARLSETYLSLIRELPDGKTEVDPKLKKELPSDIAERLRLAEKLSPEVQRMLRESGLVKEVEEAVKGGGYGGSIRPGSSPGETQ